MQNKIYESGGVMLAAVKSGSGKTTITCALLETIKQMNIDVSAFKCGPDYIDPMFHKKVIGVESRNLDTFFSNEEQIRELYCYNRKPNEISVVEGVMGLYDGLGGVRKEGSSYHLAQVLDIPIILILDAHGMGRTMISLLKGILADDKDRRIKAVILNRTSKMFYHTIKPIIEQELEIEAIGFFPKVENIGLESRHLGLKMPEEIADLQEQVRNASNVLKTNINVDKIFEIASGCGFSVVEKKSGKTEKNVSTTEKPKRKKIAIAKDEAFCFYYEDNLRILRERGAELVEFSPIHDTKLPEDIDGIILGGGYPELMAKELSNNFSMRRSIKEAIQNGIPSIAECGGFMYLHESLIDEKGDKFEMVGAIEGEVEYKGKLVRFGYVDVTTSENACWKLSAPVKAHEFHYFDSSNNGNSCNATKPVTGRNWECIHNEGNFWWGFPHLYFPSCMEIVDYFLGNKNVTMK